MLNQSPPHPTPSPEKARRSDYLKRKCESFNIRVGEMTVNEQTAESGLSHSKHKHNSGVQGNIADDYEEC